MATTTVQTPYATAMPYITSALDGWTDEYDAQRLASYDLYDDLYNNDPTRYLVMLRGQDEDPILLPTAKRIINTLARYVGIDWGYALDPDAGTDTEQTAVKQALATLFKRERVLSKFASSKKEWLRRGDWIWYLTADEDKPEGKRISLNTLDPRMYFPIFDESNLSRLSGADIIEETMVDEEPALKVQRWIKPNHPDHPDYDISPTPEDAFIWYSVTIYKVEDFGDEEKRQIIEQPVPPTELTGIPTLPLYHIKNNESTDDPFGRSDLSGLESVIAGINQSISDEDLSLAMSGLGQYWTDSGAPRDDAGNIENWKLGPARVIEVDEDSKFERVDGINSVDPFQKHVEYLESQAYGVNGITNIALGSQGANIQESGVALALRMSPLFDAAAEKDELIHAVMDQMFHDLAYWFEAYEKIVFGDVVVNSVTSDSDRLPFDRATRWSELMEGYKEGVFSLEFVLKVLQEDFGYDFDSDMLEKVKADVERKAQLVDPYAARAEEELADPSEPNPTEPPAV